jgi:hypothetical protein
LPSIGNGGYKMLTKRDLEVVRGMLMNERRGTMGVVQPFKNTEFNNQQSLLRTEVVCDRKDSNQGSIVGVGQTVGS